MEGNGGYVCYQGRPLQAWCGECRHRRPERRREERRLTRRRFRWTENRTGFDNRRPSMPVRLRRAVLALRDDPGRLVRVLLLFNIYNLADYVFTVKALAAGHREINPVMRALFAADPLLAGVFKVGTGLAVTLLIWRFRRFRLILQFSLFAFCLYLALIAYHLYGAYFI